MDINEASLSKSVRLPRLDQASAESANSIFEASTSSPVTISAGRPIDFSDGRFPIEVTPNIDLDLEGGQPIKVTPPPEVEKALFQVDFVRKLYGAHIDVLNTLEDIGFVDSYTGKRNPQLNIAYISFWRRGNSPTAGQKLSSFGTNIADTNFAIDASRQGLFDLENSDFVDRSSILSSSYTANPLVTNFNFSNSDYQDPAPWVIRAPDSNGSPSRNVNASPTSSPTSSPQSAFNPLDVNNFVFADGFTSNVVSFDQSPTFNDGDIFRQYFLSEKTSQKLTRAETISAIKQQIALELAKTPPNTQVIDRLQQQQRALEALTDDQFNAEFDEGTDPEDVDTRGVPLDNSNPIRMGDVGWSNPNISIWDRSERTEKIEGIWQFLFNPQQLEHSWGPQYKYASTWGTPEGQPAHYTGHKNQELRFRDIILNGFVFGKKVESLVKGLEELNHVTAGTGETSPPVLEFIWGKKVFGPCVMEDIVVNELKWDGGELVDATLSFTLKQIPEWTVNDGYINIFDPTGQPLQQIVTPTSTTTNEGDQAGTGTTGATGTNENRDGGSGSTKGSDGLKIDKKDSTCRGIANILSKIDEIMSRYVKKLASGGYSVSLTDQRLLEQVNSDARKEFVYLINLASSPDTLKSKLGSGANIEVAKGIFQKIATGGNPFSAVAVWRTSSSGNLSDARLIDNYSKFQIDVRSAMNTAAVRIRAALLGKCNNEASSLIASMREKLRVGSTNQTTDQIVAGRTKTEKCARIKNYQKTILETNLIRNTRDSSKVFSIKDTLEKLDRLNSNLRSLVVETGNNSDTARKVDRWRTVGRTSQLGAAINKMLWTTGFGSRDPEAIGCLRPKLNPKYNYDFDNFFNCKVLAAEIIEDAYENICK